MLLVKRDAYLFGCSKDKDVVLLMFDYEYKLKRHLIESIQKFYDVQFVNPLSIPELCLIKVIISLRPDAILYCSYETFLLLEKYCSNLELCINKLKHYSIQTYVFVEALRNKVDYCHYKRLIRTRFKYDTCPHSWSH